MLNKSKSTHTHKLHYREVPRFPAGITYSIKMLAQKLGKTTHTPIEGP